MDASPTIVAIRLFVLLLAASAAISILTRRLALPYTVGLVAFGLLLGVLVGPSDVPVTPEIVLIVLLPGLIFEAAYQIDVGRLRSTFPAVVLLAGPGVLLIAGLVAAVVNMVAGMPLEVGFVIGAIVAATDPAAVIASFKRLGAPSRLRTLVEAESLFNDGTGIVLFVVAVAAISRPTSAIEGLVIFVGVVTASAVIGLILGYGLSRVIVRVDDHLVALTLSGVLAYGTYLLADGLHLSGVIATAVAGLVLGNVGRASGLSRDTANAIDTVWEFVAFLLTAFVFLLVGRAIPIGSLVLQLGAIAAAIGAILVGRAVIVYGFVGVLRRLQPSEAAAIPIAWLHVVFWSGLRGAVSVALALSLPMDFPDRAVAQQIVFGVVLFTLVVQATTIDALLHRLGIAERAAPSGLPAPT